MEGEGNLLELKLTQICYVHKHMKYLEVIYV